MKTFRNIYNHSISDLNFHNFNICDAVFFDIETTGFSSKNTKLYLIGCLFYNAEKNCFNTMQWFLDDTNEERNIIISFFEFISNYKYIIHFNGSGFDIPYILNKCKEHDLDYSFNNINSIDLYKISCSLKNVLKTENLKQKTIERFLGINREDKFSGGELIKVYDQYLNNRDDTSLALLLLHNLEDLKGLVTITDLFYYKSIFNGEFDVSSINIEGSSSINSKNRKEVIIELKLYQTIPVRISNGNNLFYMTAFNDKVKIKVDIYSDELKYFYPNYKDYYYLPKEDKSIHKSVAFYVDKNFRTQARAANCYSKKTGQFLPQKDVIISPYFKIEYNDKITYFELTDDFLQDFNQVKSYASHILNNLS